MEKTNKPPKLFVLLLNLLYLGFVTSLPSSFTPTDHYLINCGSSNPSTVDPDHRVFKGDEDSHSSGHGFHFSPTRTFSLADPNPTPQVSSPIYHTARIFTKPSNYVFKIKQPSTHLVRLHFRGFNSSRFDLTHAQFRVFAGGFLLMNEVGSGSFTNEHIVEYILPVDSDKLLISFVPSGESKFGFVNAIEVISAPKDLILDVAQFVTADGAVKFSGFAKNALETVYRVNVGGAKVTPFNDSLWRTWVPDDAQFLSSAEGDSERVHFSGRIQYQIGGASREVGPDNVYNTARVIRSSNSSDPVSNVSWVFPVSKGYKYLIRTHFCDIASLALNSLYFDVYVNGYLASKDLDPTTITGGLLASPFYADYVVDGDSSGVINVSIGPSKWSSAHGIDGILNGVEIMKLNNSMGSLDGELPPLHSVSGCWHSVGALVPLFVGIGLLMAGFMVVYRQIFGVKSTSSVKWSQLPVVDASESNLKHNGL